MIQSSSTMKNKIQRTKRKKKRSKRPNTSISPRSKRRRLQSTSIIFSKSFRKSESFDRDVKTYFDEIKNDICDHPHNDADAADYHASIVTQFRNYLKNELPLDTKVSKQYTL